MKKRILSALLAVTVVSAMVVGCGSNSSSDSKDDKKEATEDKKELTYGSSYGVTHHYLKMQLCRSLKIRDIHLRKLM